MKLVANRNFLLKQVEVEGGKKKDVYATKGERVEVTEREAIQHWDSFKLDDATKKKLLGISRAQKIGRLY